MNPMLGCGQSNFGIISRITVRTYHSFPVLRMAAHFQRPQSAEDTPNVLARFFFNTTWVQSLPRTLTM